MKTKHTEQLPTYPSLRSLKGFEGGDVYLAEEADEYLLVSDESTLLSLLNEEDRKCLSPVTIRRFASENERNAYLMKRGWI